MYVRQIILLFTLNLQRAVCQLILTYWENWEKVKKIKCVFFSSEIKITPEFLSHLQILLYLLSSLNFLYQLFCFISGLTFLKINKILIICYCLEAINLEKVTQIYKDKKLEGLRWETPRCQFDPQVREDPWRGAWQPTPVFLPGEYPWREEPGGSTVSPRVRHD